MFQAHVTSFLQALADQVGTRPPTLKAPPTVSAPVGTSRGASRGQGQVRLCGSKWPHRVATAMGRMRRRARPPGGTRGHQPPRPRLPQERSAPGVHYILVRACSYGLEDETSSPRPPQCTMRTDRLSVNPSLPLAWWVTLKRQLGLSVFCFLSVN